MWILYQFATGLLLAIAGPILLLTRGRHYLETLPGRLGRYRDPGPPDPLWIHAVSVGEAGVAATLARALPSGLPLLVTTVTPTGQRRARAAFGQGAAVAYLPFDLGFAVNRFFARFEPRALVLAEGDYWPLLLRRARQRRLPVAVVNGRISDRGFRRMLRLKPLLGPLLGQIDCFAVQTDEDRRRLLELGVPAERVTVTGNLKYDSPEPEPRPDLEATLRELAAERPILVAGSTMAGEEEQVVQAFRALGGGAAALLLLAPRHPERWDEVERLLESSGLNVLRRSHLSGGRRPDAVLLDSMGELASLYRLAASAFVGGTLVPTGGHNPLEPARFGVPVVVGPSMENFREIAERFDRATAWVRAGDADKLAEIWRRWLDDPAEARRTGERGAAIVESSRGAVARTLEVLRPLLAHVEAEA